MLDLSGFPTLSPCLTSPGRPPTAGVVGEVSNRHASKAGGAGGSEGTCKMKDTVGIQGKSDRMQITCYN